MRFGHLNKTFAQFVIIIAAYLFAPANLQAQYYNRSPYQDFVIAHNKIYVLLGDRTIKSFSLDNVKAVERYKPDTTIRLITTDHNGDAVIVEDNKTVKRFDEKKDRWENIASYAGKILYTIAFNNQNEGFLITDEGIFDLKTKKEYFPDRTLSHSEWAFRGQSGWGADDYAISTFTDSDNDIWIWFSHGEWGDDLFIFNDHTFLPFAGETVAPEFEYNGHIYGTYSGLIRNVVVRYDRQYKHNSSLFQYKATLVYNSEKDPSYAKLSLSDDIGSRTYNALNGCFYVMSSKGLLKGDPRKAISEFSDWKLVKTLVIPKRKDPFFESVPFKYKKTTKPHWIPEYTGKIEFTSKGILVILMDEKGIGIFDGKKLKVVK